jgi:hypothetical protein
VSDTGTCQGYFVPILQHVARGTHRQGLRACYGRAEEVKAACCDAGRPSLGTGPV